MKFVERGFDMTKGIKKRLIAFKMTIILVFGLTPFVSTTGFAYVKGTEDMFLIVYKCK